MTRVMSLALVVGSLAAAAAQDATLTRDKLLRRHYEQGERLTYRMKGENDGSSYEVRMTATTKKDADGRFFEEYAWSDLVSNGNPRPLPPKSQKFRLAVTLEPGGPPFSPPDLSQAPNLIGPVLDLMTFYADLFLAMHSGKLREAGDQFKVPSPATGSWADGQGVLLGEDAVDFEIALTTLDEATDVATLLVKHVPPEEPNIQLPAGWMHDPVSDTANNWVQVRNRGEIFVASVGTETFDVEMRIDLKDGKILSATMENPVDKVTRECRDAALTDCGAARRSPTFRRIEMELME